MHKSDMRAYGRCVKVRLLLLLILLPLVCNACAPQIKLSDPAADVTIRYTHKLKFDGTSDLLPYLTEEQIFSEADVIFSGRIKEIRNIEISQGEYVIYRSLVKIKVNEIYKGECNSSTLTVISYPIGWIEAEDEDLLRTLKRGQLGIFLAKTVAEGESFTEGSLTFPAFEICDARFCDGVRFGFIKKINGDARCCDNLENGEWSAFSSLTHYDWDSVEEYVRRMTEYD